MHSQSVSQDDYDDAPATDPGRVESYAARGVCNREKPLVVSLTKRRTTIRVTLDYAVEGESIKAPVKLCGTYRLRRSEALGLKWNPVDFKRKTIAMDFSII